MILAVCLNPTMQKTLVFDSFHPGEVNRVVDERLDASGKGVNVARVAVELGAPAVHLTHTGGREAERFRQLCRADKVDLADVVCDSEIRFCTTVVDRSTSTTTEIVEPTQPVPAGTEEQVLARFAELLDRADTVVLSGSTAPGYSADLFPRMVRLARTRGITVIADFRGEALKNVMDSPRELLPTVIKPNLKEFAETFLFGGARSVSEHSDDQQTLQRTEKQMRRLHEAGTTVILTRGAHPTMMIDETGALVQIPVTPLDPVNTIGCGDAFTAGLAVELRAGSSLSDAIDRAHAAAAMNATNLKPGSIRPV